MNLGYYYHIPCFIDSNGKIGMPSYQGLFIDSLATEVDHLYCFLHTQPSIQSVDYWITSQNISIVSLGPDSPAYIKTFLSGRFLTNEVRKNAAKCDKIIIRGPSALLHSFPRISSRDKLVYFIVGSFKEGLKHTYSKWYRIFAIRLLMRYIDHKQQIVLKGANILVNSKTNAEKYRSIAQRLGIVYTTTLMISDLFIREDTCQSGIIKIVYVGRIDWAKGLRELIKAFQIVNRKFNNAELHFIGWEENSSSSIQREINTWANQNQLSTKVFFHGKKAAGSELLHFYRTGDLYVLPSYFEGFPRTIWEAMASSLPVITTTVGSIPDFLEHKENAFLIPPHDQEALEIAICELIENVTLRKKLIKGGIDRVSEVTLEVQAKRIIKFITNE